MAVRRISTSKTIHIVYDREYELNPESLPHLPDLREPFKELGYDVMEHFIHPTNMRERLRGIPKRDRNHIIFMHIDMPPNVPVGTPIETVRFIEQNFHYVVGFRSDYCENCVWKSIMNQKFEQMGVPHLKSIRVTVCFTMNQFLLIFVG